MDKEQSRRLAQAAVDALLPAANEEFIGYGVEHPPIIVLDLRNGMRRVVDLRPIMESTPNGGLAKDLVAQLHHSAARNAEVECATLVMEAWALMKKTEPGEPLTAPAGSLRDAPGRIEVVMFNCLAGEWQWMCMCEIDRKACAAAKGELFCTAEEGTHVEGRMVRR